MINNKIETAKMKKKVMFSAEEIAKYNTVSVFGALQELAGIRTSAGKLQLYYDAMLRDLQSGAMERSCKEYDRICRETILADNN